jgi:hypothetical protein
MAGDELKLRKKLKSLQRIAAVKEQQCRLAESKLARLTSEENALLADEEAILAALNADEPLHGLFVEGMSRHLRRLAEKLAALRRAREEEAARLRTLTGERKHAERLRDDTSRHHGRVAEDRALAELVEASLAHRAASLP